MEQTQIDPLAHTDAACRASFHRTPEQIRFLIELGAIDPRADDELCVHFMYYEVGRAHDDLFGGPTKVPNETNIRDTIRAMSAEERAAFRDKVLAQPCARFLKSDIRKKAKP